MMELTAEEQNKLKRMRKLRIFLENSETILNTPTSEL